MSLNNLERKASLGQAQETNFDLIVIGGGITGCGIALDASARGMKTLLVEKSDYAAGTSSKSTKLIHGGLRYLKQLEFGLVRETGVERAVVHHLAPHLVHPEKMFLPIVEKGTFGKMSASLAISVYDFLAKVEQEDQKESIDREEAIAQEPLVRSDFLTGGILYSEYRTDDARLTIELMKKAQSMGCECFNYMEMLGGIYGSDKKISGIKCLDQISGKEVEFSAKKIVSAAGPWVDGIRKNDGSFSGSKLHLTKGVHIVIDRKKLNLNQSVYFDDFKGRMIFAIPRGRITYVGTTDTTYHEDLDRVLAKNEDVRYILDAVNHFFDIPALSISDVESTWAGLRPLIHQEGKSPTELSRKDEIFTSPTGLISIAGGKLTGYRKMAQRIVDIVADELEVFSDASCTTDEIKLTRKAFLDYDEVQYFVSRFEKDILEIGLDAYYSWYLISTYGKDAKQIFDEVKLSEELNKEKALLIAELRYCVENEGVIHPLDLLMRRTGRVYFDIKSVHSYYQDVIDASANIFEASEETVHAWKLDIESALRDAVSFKKID